MLLENPSNYQKQAFEIIPMYGWISIACTRTRIIIHWLCLGRRVPDYRNTIYIKIMPGIKGLAGEPGNPIWMGFV